MLLEREYCVGSTLCQDTNNPLIGKLRNKKSLDITEYKLFKNSCHLSVLKAAYSVTMNIFRKKIFSFLIICKSRIKLCCHNKSNFYN